MKKIYSLVFLGLLTTAILAMEEETLYPKPTASLKSAVDESTQNPKKYFNTNTPRKTKVKEVLRKLIIGKDGSTTRGLKTLIDRANSSKKCPAECGPEALAQALTQYERAANQKDYIDHMLRHFDATTSPSTAKKTKKRKK